MPNEIAYYDDENGNRSYFADDTAREQIKDIEQITTYTTFDPSQYPSWDDFPHVAIGYGYSAQTNSPGFNGFVFCFGGSAHRTQVTFAYNGTAQKYRSYISGAWSAWKELGPIDRVAANSFGSSEDITAYASSSQYTCPKDGYVTLVLANGASGSVWIGGRELLTVSSSQGRTVQSVFVKAGMSVRLTDASGTKYLYYEPLNY